MSAGRNYQGRDGELRLLDNSQASALAGAGTPWGMKVLFEQMDMRINYQQRPEELPRMDRELLTVDAHHQTGAETNLLTPIDFTMSMVVSSEETDAILDFVGANWANKATANTGDAVNPWAVKGTPAAGLVTTKSRPVSGSGQYRGGRINSRGSAVAIPAFADAKKVAVDVESIWTERTGVKKWGMRIKEAYFEPGRQTVNESADFVTINLTGMIYGEVESITSFSRAMNVLTSQMLP